MRRAQKFTCAQVLAITTTARSEKRERRASIISGVNATGVDVAQRA